MLTNARLIDRLRLAEKVIRETPVQHLNDENLDLYTKLEYLNGVGSVKDRPALWILKRAIERGEVGPKTTVVESSSGNFACALATFCRILKLKFIPVVDPNVSPAYEAYLRATCQHVVKVDTRDETGGYLKTRLDVVKSLLMKMPDAYWPNQYENLDGMEAHYCVTASEICDSLPHLDYVFLGVSSAGTIAGVSQRIKERNPSTRVIAVDAEGSVIFGQSPKKRFISGIGSSIVPPLLKHALIDGVVIVTEADTVRACHELLDVHGLFVGGSTGSVYSAIGHFFGAKLHENRPTVLFLCCDRGTAYLHNVFDSNWEAGRTSEARASVG